MNLVLAARLDLIAAPDRRYLRSREHLLRRRDGIVNIEPARAPFRFREALPPTVYAGLAITAHDTTRVTEGRFRDLRLEMASVR